MADTQAQQPKAASGLRQRPTHSAVDRVRNASGSGSRRSGVDATSASDAPVSSFEQAGAAGGAGSPTAQSSAEQPSHPGASGPAALLVPPRTGAADKAIDERMLAQLTPRSQAAVLEGLSPRALRDFAKKRARQMVLGDANRSLRDALAVELNKPMRVMMRDKVTFFLAVLGLLATQYVLLARPHLFWAWFTLLSIPLMTWRYVSFTRRKWGFFLADFCYAANLLAAAHVWIAPRDPYLFEATFMLANGPVLWAVLAWRNSMVFHDYEKMTSVFIHVIPALLTFAQRWHYPAALNGRPEALPPYLSCVPLSEAGRHHSHWLWSGAVAVSPNPIPLHGWAAMHGGAGSSRNPARHLSSSRPDPFAPYSSLHAGSASLYPTGSEVAHEDGGAGTKTDSGSSSGGPRPFGSSAFGTGFGSEPWLEDLGDAAAEAAVGAAEAASTGLATGISALTGATGSGYAQPAAKKGQGQGGPGVTGGGIEHDPHGWHGGQGGLLGWMYKQLISKGWASSSTGEYVWGSGSGSDPRRAVATTGSHAVASATTAGPLASQKPTTAAAGGAATQAGADSPAGAAGATAAPVSSSSALSAWWHQSLARSTLMGWWDWDAPMRKAYDEWARVVYDGPLGLRKGHEALARMLGWQVPTATSSGTTGGGSTGDGGQAGTASTSGTSHQQRREEAEARSAAAAEALAAASAAETGHRLSKAGLSHMAAEKFTTCDQSYWRVMGLPILLYALWQVGYLFYTEVCHRRTLAEDPGLVTSLRWLAKSRGGVAGIITKGARMLRILGPKEELDSEDWRTKGLFVWFQLTYTLLTMAPTKLLYDHYYAHAGLLLFIVASSIWQGGAFYIEDFSVKYAKRLNRAAAVAGRHGDSGGGGGASNGNTSDSGGEGSAGMPRMAAVSSAAPGAAAAASPAGSPAAGPALSLKTVTRDPYLASGADPASTLDSAAVLLGALTGNAPLPRPSPSSASDSGSSAGGGR